MSATPNPEAASDTPALGPGFPGTDAPPYRLVPTVIDPEELRIRELHRHLILDTTPDEVFNTLARMAAELFRMPLALIALVDRNRVWFKASVGMRESEVARTSAPCPVVATVTEPLVVNDLADHPLGIGSSLGAEPLAARFYAGAPMISSSGFTLGAFAVADRQPRRIEAHQIEFLRQFAGMAVREIESRMSARELASANQALRLEVALKARAESELGSARRRLERIFDCASNAIFAADRDGRLTHMNHSACELTGFSEMELLGKPLDSLLVRDGIDTVRWTELARADPGGRDRIVNLKRRDGAMRRVELSVAELDTGDGGHVAAGQDVTERERMEAMLAQAQKMEAVSLLAGGIAHDLNNILTAVLGSVTSVRAGLFDPAENDEALKDAEDAARRASYLVGQFLTMSKGDHPSRTAASLPELVGESVRLALRGSRVAARFDFEPDLWPVEVDAGQLARVVHNLALNALEAVGGGGGILEVTAVNTVWEALPPEVAARLSPGGHVKVIFQDDGPGIPAEVLRRVFEPYFTTKSTGNGLGLATAYSIVANNRGALEVDSPPGAGARFTVYVPAASAMAMAAPAPRRRAGDSSARLPAIGHSAPAPVRRLLILDDEPGIRRMVRRGLAARNWDVVETETPGDALNKYRAAAAAGQPFSAVLVDLTIPGTAGGVAFTRGLMEFEPGARAIVSSGFSLDPVLSDPSAYGFSGVLRKPYSLQQLRAMIDRIETDALADARPEEPHAGC